MNFELSEEHRMLKDLVQKFVRDELMPLETAVMQREASGQGIYINAEERAKVDEVSQKLGLWGLDAPEDVGGADLPQVALIAVNEAMGSTVTPYTLPPDSPNLRMLMATVNERQREAYLAPYVAGKTISAIGISEPGAGADPAGMMTRAVRDGDDWVINGRKIWTSRAAEADFTILMAVTDKEKGSRGGISAFLVDGDTPGFNGDFAAAARSIKARVVMFPNCHDQLHPAREGGVLEAAALIPVAKLVDIDDIGGHRGSRSAKALAQFDTEVRDLLKRIEDKRAGISGPRFPRNWIRTDYCRA